MYIAIWKQNISEKGILYDTNLDSLEKVKLEAGHLEHLESGYHNDISCDK